MKTRHYKIFFVFLLLIGLTHNAYASNEIHGRVLDKETNDPIPKAKIKYKYSAEENFNWGTVSDSKGEFKFTLSHLVGILELEFEADGYPLNREEIILNAIDPNSVVLYLTRSPQLFDETFVVNHRPANEIIEVLSKFISLNSSLKQWPGNKIRFYGYDKKDLEIIRTKLSEYDVPPKQILVQVMLITANGGERKNVEYDPKVKQIVKQLTSLFKYNYYWVIGQAEMVGMENEPFSVMNEGTQSAFAVNTLLKYQDGVIKLEGLKISVNKPNHAEIMTTVNVRNGETVILGASGGENESEALITAVTAKVVD